MRFKPDGAEASGFTPIEISDVAGADPNAPPLAGTRPAPSIEITLEKGRRLSVGEDVDAGFVLELARGLAA